MAEIKPSANNVRAVLDELSEARRRLQDAIVACTELGMDHAALIIAKDQAERERDRLVRMFQATGSVNAVNLHQATRLLEYALRLRQHGERAPGGDETWDEFDRVAEAFLRTGGQG